VAIELGRSIQREVGRSITESLLKSPVVWDAA
jgi:hypothetical protein